MGLLISSWYWAPRRIILPLMLLFATFPQLCLCERRKLMPAELKDIDWDLEIYRCPLCITVVTDIMNNNQSFKAACTAVNACDILDKRMPIVNSDPRASCQSGGMCGPRAVSKDSRKPKATVHIGPPKTGTSHMQADLTLLHDKLWEKNIFYPIFFFSHAKEPEFPQFLKLQCVVAEEMNMDLVISTEFFMTYDLNMVSEVAEMLKNFHVTIVWTYREILSAELSKYSQETRYQPMSREITQNLMKYVSRYNGWGQLLKWGTPFGIENVVVLDYYGIPAAGKDISDVFVCEVLGLWCETTVSELINGKDEEKSNPSRKDEVYFPLCAAVIDRLAQVKCEIKKNKMHALIADLHEESQKAEANQKPFPEMELHFDLLLPYIDHLELDLRQKAEAAEIKWLCSDVEANRNQRRSAQYTQVSTLDMLYDDFWSGWFHHYIKQLHHDKANYLECF